MGIKIGNVKQVKAGTLARTDTSAKALFSLPANAMVIGISAFGTNSNAATSATITLKSRPVDGSSAAASFGTLDAKATSAKAVGATLLGIAFARQSMPVYITAEYAEEGTASTAGGDWTILVEYL
jgi:hypothetical protein